MMSENKVPVLCRFGGDFIWESNEVCYRGGTNRIVHVDRAIHHLTLLSKVRGLWNLIDISSVKYKYPGLDLDSLVSIENDDDVSNMMEAFTQSNEPVHLFVCGAQNLSIPIPITSDLMQNVNNGNVQASLRDLHGSNGTIAPSSHNANTDNNDVPNAPSSHNAHTNNNAVPNARNDLHEMDCLMDNQESPGMVVDNCVNDMPKMMSVLKEGQEFEDANAFHNALREYAIRSNFEYKRIRSGGGRYQAKCIEENCSWRIHACKLPNKLTFKIKSLKGNHTCNATNELTMSNTRMHRQATRKWIASLVKDRLQKDLLDTPNDIVDMIRQEYGVEISYDKAWRGKELALKGMPCEQHDPDLRMLCEEIQRTNPGSTAKVSRSSDNSLRLFVAYKAVIHGFKHACRPLVRLYCKKMEGKSQGVWLFAMAFDADQDAFPISCAFVESKNIESWKWFCDELAQVLGPIPKLTFISDRREEEGILEVVSGIFPKACHRYSQWELIREIQQEFKCSDLTQLFESAVYAGVHSEFNARMGQIHEKYKEAGDFLKNIKPEHWATSYFKKEHYVCCDLFLDSMFNLELNSVMADLHNNMIDIFNARFKDSSCWETRLVPGLEEVISEVELSEYCVSGRAAEFEVVYGPFAEPKKVDLKRRTCSCLNWQIFGYPCNHAIAAIRYSGCNVYDYVDEYFTVAKYRETYSAIIHPLHLPNTSLSQQKKRKHEDFDKRRLL